MSNDVILTIETRKPHTFMLSPIDYKSIIDEYRDYTRDYQYTKNIFSKLVDRLTNRPVDITSLPTTWTILYRELDKHIREYGRGSIIADNREIYARYEKHLEYITEMSTEIIVNMYIDREVKLYLELYKFVEDEIIYDSYITLKPMECLIVKPGSYIKTHSKDNNLLIVHISPIYIRDGFLGEPIYDRVFIDELII